MDVSSQHVDDIDDVEDDNGDRLINDFMCDILEDENDEGEFDNDSRLSLVAESVHMLADPNTLKHKVDDLLLDRAIDN